MRRIRILLLALLVVLAPALARAEGEVDLALVLLTDVSRSVDGNEYDLIKQGYRAALTDPRVVAAIRGGALGAIAISYVEFAGLHEVQTVVDWVVVRDAESAAAFANRVAEAPRRFWGRTSISAGIEHALASLAGAGLEAQRRVIDVCGDGTNNSGREVVDARDMAVQAGVTINALVILSEPVNEWTRAHVQPPGGLTQYFRENVIGGPGAFLIEIDGFAAFGEAMTRKLINEIAGKTPGTRFAGAE